ncbi:P-loop containing nucleoside triphosphate hydrolase protein, partial [Scenedesmus sp. NREL 46B-D3]
EAWAAWFPSPWHNQLAEISSDVFALLPKQYNAQHKNPCWGGLGPGLSCLPYFNIIGVSKCGTTDLYHRLTLHKQILPATNKGPHFWDECPYPPAHGGCTAGPSGDFQAYINLFSRAADLVRSRPEAITGEASSNTFTSANGVYLRGFRGDKPWAAWAGGAGLNASMPALLKEAQPYLRLIVMLRDPVDRYYSAYHYYRWWEQEQRQLTADDFHAHALREMQQWRDCVAAAGLSTCVRRYQPQQLVKGMYSQFLQDWLAHFPRHQLLLLRYEDYKAALPQHLEAVLQFLEVSMPEPASWQAMLNAAVQNKKAYPAMRPDTQQLLREFYAPFNTELAQVLDGDCRWLWRESGRGEAPAGAHPASPNWLRCMTAAG